MQPSLFLSVIELQCLTLNILVAAFFHWPVGGTINGLLTFFIFLVCCLRIFLYKGMLSPSFITETLRYILNLQLSPYAFKIFLFFIIFYLCAMGSFPWQVFLLLVFLFCSTVFLAIKLHQHLSFQHSHFKSLYIIAASRVFLPRSLASICPCIEAVPTFNLVMKQRQHFIRANIDFCHKAASTFYLH